VEGQIQIQMGMQCKGENGSVKNYPSKMAQHISHIIYVDVTFAFV
jgi:hypothetical protein